MAWTSSHRYQYCGRLYSVHPGASVEMVWVRVNEPHTAKLIPSGIQEGTETSLPQGEHCFSEKNIFYDILIFKACLQNKLKRKTCKRKFPTLGNTKKQGPCNFVIFIPYLLAFQFSLVSNYLCFSHCCPMEVSDSGMAPCAVAICCSRGANCPFFS